MSERTANPEPRQAYELWHRALGVDEEASAPWHEMIRAALPPEAVAGGDVLEMATGRGEWSHALLRLERRPRRLAAGDISLSAIAMASAFARRAGLPPALWFVGDLERLPFRDSAFSTVFCCETIEHLPSPRRGVCELARALAPRGELFLSVPNYLNLALLYRAYRRLICRPFQEAGQPINRILTPLRVLWLLWRSRLRVRAVDGRGHVIPLWRGRPALRLGERWDRIRGLRWFAAQQLFIAHKPEVRG